LAGDTSHLLSYQPGLTDRVLVVVEDRGNSSAGVGSVVSLTIAT
jgi:hypothetical protein